MAHTYTTTPATKPTRYAVLPTPLLMRGGCACFLSAAWACSPVPALCSLSSAGSALPAHASKHGRGCGAHVIDAMCVCCGEVAPIVMVHQRELPFTVCAGEPHAHPPRRNGIVSVCLILTAFICIPMLERTRHPAAVALACDDASDGECDCDDGVCVCARARACVCTCTRCVRVHVYISLPRVGDVVFWASRDGVVSIGPRRRRQVKGHCSFNVIPCTSN